MDWLRDRPAGLTLSSDFTSFVLTSRTLRSTFLSDGSQTPQYAEKLAELGAVFTRTWEPAAVTDFLHRHAIRYVFWTAREEKFFDGFTPDKLPNCTVQYTTATARVYQCT